MKVVKSPGALTEHILKLKRKGKRVGFVPTMGFLHEGHLSLIRRARKESDVVVVSIFVNPTQFGPKEDFKRYPRNAKRDLKMLAAEKVDFVFAPTVRGMYPGGLQKCVKPGPLADVLCGPKRPGHFRGVVTVVKRLFDIVQPDLAYFGQKDFQQARIIEEMIKRFHLPIQMKVCPIVREKNGLAMSSRNVYLSQDERIRAGVIPEALSLAKRLIRSKTISLKQVESKVVSFLKPRVDKLNYAKVVDAISLRHAIRRKGSVLVAIACFIGRTRLIDNILIRV